MGEGVSYNRLRTTENDAATEEETLRVTNGRSYVRVSDDDAVESESVVPHDESVSISEPSEGTSLGHGPEEEISINILDVNGQTYKLQVKSSDSIGEVKRKLLVVSGIEEDRQRLIYMGRVLTNDAVLSSLKISDKTTIHLFQRPKGPEPVGLEGVSLSVQNVGTTQTGTIVQEDSHIQGELRGIRLLSYFLFFYSVLELLEIFGFMSTREEAQDCPLPASIYLTVLRSLCGLCVGAIGAKLSTEPDPDRSKTFVVGLAVTATVSLAARIQSLVLVLTDSVAQCNCPSHDTDNSMSSYSSASEGYYAGAYYYSSTFSSSSLPSPWCQPEAKNASASVMAIMVVSSIVLPFFVWLWSILLARHFSRAIIQEAQRMQDSRNAQSSVPVATSV